VRTAAKSTTLKTAGVARIEARCGSGLLRSAPIVVEKPPLRTTGVASGRLWTAQGELKPLISTPFPSLQSCCLLTAACVLTNEKTADGLPRAGYLLRLALNFYLIRGKPSLANNRMQSNCWSCIYDLVGLRLLSYSFSREGLKIGIATGAMFGSQSYRLPLASDPFSFKKFAAMKDQYSTFLPHQPLEHPSNCFVRLEMLCDSTFLERLRRCWLWVSLNLFVKTLPIYISHANRVCLGLLAVCDIPFFATSLSSLCVRSVGPSSALHLLHPAMCFVGWVRSM
jgi:hypothetical protein